MDQGATVNQDWLGSLARDGFAVIEGAVSTQAVAELTQLMQRYHAGDGAGVLERSGETYGMRHLLWRSPEIQLLAASRELMRIAGEVLGTGAFAVRGLYFDKTPTTNWNLPWHQDLTIAVRARRDVPGFGPWTVKAGVPHVIAPASLLERMVTLRLHLDECGPYSGPMRVLPGSHRDGKLDPGRLATWAARAKVRAVDCLVGAGGAVVMRPLLVHASSAGTGPGHRRVIHLEYAAEALPDGLEWHMRPSERESG
jgi:ectoine hydroxylase-related dioxygenase (phytanoyl-CoA dioxygenase family)